MCQESGVGAWLGAEHGFRPPPGCLHSALTRSGIPSVEFGPDPPLQRLSEVADVDSQSHTIDEQMDWFICDDSPEPEVLESL
jgi:hypothetical protein